MKTRFLLLWACCSGLSACAFVHRSDSSGYANSYSTQPNTVANFYQERFTKKFREAATELGYNLEQPLQEEAERAIRNRIILKNLEKRIPSYAEKKQYYDLKPYMLSDTEKIQFLTLPDSETRSRWAQSRSISSVETKFDFTTQTLIEKSDIMKGMSRNAVRQSWGEPDSTEVAGNPIYGNERWVFKKLISSEEGYKHEIRYVYFESGRVIGWETAGHN